MRHNPERDAAAYLGGTLTRRRRRRFEDHLLECEQCWREVAEARRGRSVAEAARELAPQSVRELVRAAVAGAEPPSRRFPLPWLATAAVALLVLAGATAVVLVVRPDRPARQPAPIARAIDDFLSDRLPAGRPPSLRALDLSGLGFEVVGAGSGEVGDLAVDAFRYRDAAGRRIHLYLSEQPFPVALGAHRSDRPDGPWTAEGDGVELLCAQRPLPLLAISDDPAALRSLAAHLGVG
jgi:anti-sigma factor RsiW